MFNYITSTSICLLVTIVAAIYFFFKTKFSYWKNRGIPCKKPTVPYGNLGGLGTSIHLAHIITNIYNKQKGKTPFIGSYFFTHPTAIISDLEMVKDVLIKDFNYFHDRGIFYNERDDPISAHMFAVDGIKWKQLRSKLSPTFTSGRMKFMYPTVIGVADQFKETLSTIVHTGRDLELKDLLARFTTDIIGTCAFGIECNSLKDPNAEFRMKGKKVFENPRNNEISRLFLLCYRNFSKFFRLKSEYDDVNAFFLKVVRETIDLREQHNIKRNDFMDLLIQLKNTGKLEENGEHIGNLSVEEIAAQAFIFFLAGFETSSTTMCYSLYEMALNPDLQEKARQDIFDVIEKHNGEFTYDAMKEMVYIDKVINEALRKYPPVHDLMRKATKNYKVRNMDVVIEKDTTIVIPVYGIHHDPDIYENPEVFDPERFSAENIKDRPSIAFLAFGDGPRNCVGLRFGMMQTRVGLVTLLRNYKFSICSETQIPLKFDLNNVVLSPDGGLFLHIEKL